MSTSSGKSWRLARNGEEYGPYTSQELSQMGHEGHITSDMVVWREGMDDWQPVTKVKGLRVTSVAPAPPPVPVAPAITVAVTPSRIAAPMPVRGHVTIEKTSKALKLQQLLGLLCIVIGLALVAIGASANKPGSTEINPIVPVGSLLFVGGLVWRIITRLRIWWHHG